MSPGPLHDGVREGDRGVASDVGGQESVMSWKTAETTLQWIRGIHYQMSLEGQESEHWELNIGFRNAYITGDFHTSNFGGIVGIKFYQGGFSSREEKTLR